MADEKKAVEHKSVYAAIAAAVGDVKQLGKSDRNKFDGYDFVSIDKFLALVNPICATHGLFPSINQDSVELYENTNSKGGTSTWARFHYSVSLHHSSGETFGPMLSMVAVPMNGAQASGSAQSYALKQFFRGILMIPTGDKDDPDLNATEQHHKVSNTPAPKQATPVEVETAVENINAAETLAGLGTLWTMLNKNAPHVVHDATVIDAKNARKAELSAALLDDEIPG